MPPTETLKWEVGYQHFNQIDLSDKHDFFLKLAEQEKDSKFLSCDESRRSLHQF
jgi:hypothetical protein